MEHRDFRIGTELWCSGRRWRCTDVRTRLVVAIRVDAADLAQSDKGVVTHFTLDGLEAERQGWFDGPPYAVLESVFDEYGLGGCSLQPEDEDAA